MADGSAGRRVSRSDPAWRQEFEETLPDLRDEDIAGSGFAITGYTVLASLGGDAALARLRERLRARGLRLMLDFVPNHTALDHPWVEAHPEYYVAGSEADLARCAAELRAGDADRRRAGAGPRPRPLLPGLAGHAAARLLRARRTQEAMLDELLAIAAQCDGVRCDMAMLVLPDVFERTWGAGRRVLAPATARVREQYPGFCFMAEVYWDLEWTLLQQGFDYAYDKRLYDRLRAGAAGPVRDHLAGRPGLPGPPRAFPGEPRRAPRGRDLPARPAPGRGGHHVPRTRPALLPSGSARGLPRQDLPASRPRPAGACG